MGVRTCPLCGVALREDTVGGVALGACPACEAVAVEREGLLRLRGVARSAHPALSAGGGPPGGQQKGERSCPACAASMEAFHYRGGKVYVDRCTTCDLLFLDRGELAALLDEWEQGLEMSEQARSQLEEHRQRALWERLLGAEWALTGVALFSLALFFYLGFEGTDAMGLRRGYALPIPLAIAVALGVYVFLRRRARGERRSARRAVRDYYRRKESAARGTSRVRSEPTSASGDASSRGKPRAIDRCPWCGAPLFPASRRCTACDSDVF